MKIAARIRLPVAAGGASALWPLAGRRSRAMPAIFLGFAFFLLAQFALSLTVETVKPEWRDPEYGHRIHPLLQLQAEHPKRPLVVAIGSSRTLMGFSPSAMELPDEAGSPLVYNFGQTGAGPIQILLTALRILDDGVKPDCFLIELFPAALVGDGPAEGMIPAWGPRWNAGDVRRLAPYADDPSRLKRAWLAERLTPWHSLRFPLMNHWLPRWLPNSHRLDFQWKGLQPYGWLPYPVASLPEEQRARLTAAAGESYRRQLAHYAIGATSDRALRDLAALCQRERIRIAFYLMPEGPAFASWYSPGARSVFEEYARRLSRETGAPIFDCSEGFAETDFADSHHMLPGGAARFSKRFADEFLKK